MERGSEKVKGDQDKEEYKCRHTLTGGALQISLGQGVDDETVEGQTERPLRERLAFNLHPHLSLRPFPRLRVEDVVDGLLCNNVSEVRRRTGDHHHFVRIVGFDFGRGLGGGKCEGLFCGGLSARFGSCSCELVDDLGLSLFKLFFGDESVGVEVFEVVQFRP